MNYNQAIKYIYSKEGLGWKLGLYSIKTLLKKLKNPEKELKTIHIAGTNGKGSTAAMLTSILVEAGYKVGTYISPHLNKFNERITINKKEISNKDIASFTKKIKPFITKQTYFEVVTALALLYFKEKKVDFAIIEVGLGGRLDATNVINPIATVITNISLEHTSFLGKTISQIAKEKAGIIKKQVPVITGAKGDALKAIKQIAKKKQCNFYPIKKFKINNGTFNINSYKNLKLSLKGDFQIENAALAITTIDILKKENILNINKKSISDGLKKTIWPGRMEYLKKNILVDCAHNPAAIKALKKEIQKLNYNKLILIIGILKDKNAKEILKNISPMADEIILTRPKTERANEPEELLKHIKQQNKIIIKDVKQALKFAKIIAKKQDLILITGSIFVVGEAKS